MEKFQKSLFNMFILNEANYISGWFAITFGLISAALTIGFSIPQIVQVYKKKSAGNIKYYSFWLFYIGTLGWIILGAFDNNAQNVKNFIVVYTNLITLFINQFLLFMLYKYSNSQLRRKLKWVVLSITTTIFIIIAVISNWALWGKTNDGGSIKLSEKALLIIGQIIPIITAFAFLPQILKSIDTRDFTGMSLGMIILALCSNIGWTAYWVSYAINAGGFQNQYISALIWQAISFLVFALIFIFTIIDKFKKKEVIKNV